MTTSLGRVVKPPMVPLTCRIPPKLKDAVEKAAAEDDENLSDVVRKALELYVEQRES